MVAYSCYSLAPGVGGKRVRNRLDLLGDVTSWKRETSSGVIPSANRSSALTGDFDRVAIHRRCLADELLVCRRLIDAGRGI